MGWHHDTSQSFTTKRFEISYSPRPYQKQWTDTPNSPTPCKIIGVTYVAAVAVWKTLCLLREMQPTIEFLFSLPWAVLCWSLKQLFSCAKFDRDRCSISFTMSTVMLESQTVVLLARNATAITISFVLPWAVLCWSPKPLLFLREMQTARFH